MSLMVRLADLERKVERLMLASASGMTQTAMTTDELAERVAAIEARIAADAKPRRFRKDA